MTSDALVFRAPRFAAFALLASALLALTSCAISAPTESTPAAGPPAVDAGPPGHGEYVEIDTGGRGLLLVRRDHQLGRYDQLLIEHVGFSYSPTQRWLSFRQEDRIRSMLTAAVEGSHDGEIGLADDSGPCVLGVRFYVTDLELHTPALQTGSTTSFVNSFGEATMILELRDTESNVPIAHFLQRRELGGGPANGATGTSIRRLGTVVGVAMRDMGRQLQRLTPPTASGWDAECKGGMTRVAIGSH